MSQGKSEAGVAAPATDTWCLVLSASRGIRAPASSSNSTGRPVARGCFENTSILARSWCEADVSKAKSPEKAGRNAVRDDGFAPVSHPRSRLAHKQDTRLKLLLRTRRRALLRELSLAR